MENEVIRKRLRENPELIKKKATAIFHVSGGVFHSKENCAPPEETREVSLREVVTGQMCECVLDSSLPSGQSVYIFSQDVFNYFSRVTLAKLKNTSLLSFEDLLFLTNGVRCDSYADEIEGTEELFGKVPYRDYEKFVARKEEIYNALINLDKNRKAVEEYAQKAAVGELSQHLKELNFPKGVISEMVSVAEKSYQDGKKMLIYPEELNTEDAERQDPVADFFINERFFPDGKAKFLVVPLAVAQRLESDDWVKTHPDLFETLTTPQLEVLISLYERPQKYTGEPALYSSLEKALNAARSLA